jgi:HAD superfamily hydrolase (TIGR01509 family)
MLDNFLSVTTGCEVTNGKPAPDIFLLAAERLGADPATCLVIEDTPLAGPL